MGRGRVLLLLGVLVAVPVAVAGIGLGPPLTGWLSFGNNNARTGYMPQQSVTPGSLALQWTAQVDGTVTAQPLVLRDVPGAGDRTIYVVTSKGLIYGINQNGYVVLKRQLGTMTLPGCPYFTGNHYGITGTPTIDPVSHTLYVADALGYVHALDPATLQDRPGWPVRLFSDTSKQLVWGALTLARGKLFVPTGLLCAQAATHLYALDVGTRKVRAWSPVPLSLGGGGGMWGWGGVAYDARTKTILAATGDALPGGRNLGRRFTESAGYAEHLVQLDLGLHVRQSGAPRAYRAYADQDLTGSPIVMRASGCPALVAVERKDGSVYVWRLGAIGKGVYWHRRLAPKLNGQPAWSPATRSLYVVGHTRAYRLELTSSCSFQQDWAVPLAGSSVKGPPLITGNTVWFAVPSAQELWAIDATSGQLLWKGGLAEAAFAPPAIVDGRVYAVGYQGLVAAFG